jgi:DNA repair protein RecN (Recombination protein N)
MRIERLGIQNYAYRQSSLEFGKGLHVFTGETGAGKSIIVGALGLLLGEKADQTVIRAGAEKAVVEAEFSVVSDYVLERLRESGVEEPSTLILRREVAAGGKSRAFVNGMQQPISQLERSGNGSSTFTSARPTNCSLQQKVHIDLLDAYGGFYPDRKTASGLLAQLNETVRQKAELESDEAKLESERIFWQTAADEIGKAAFDPGEEDELKRQLDRTEYAERIQTALSGAHSKLYSTTPPGPRG